MSTETNPLTAPAPEEVPLPRAPLVRVIAQVRFSSILAVRQAEFIAAFQETIRADYPILHREHELLLSPQGVATAEPQVVWRFTTEAEDAWRVSLTPDFVALETTAYTSRSDLIRRMEGILEAVEEHLRPEVAVRVGLRYIDRVTGQELDHIGDLVRPDILGIVNTPLFEHAEQELSNALLNVPGADDEKIRARWGHLPADVTVDPHAIEPIGERSWILDLDMFSTEQRPFEAEALARDLERFAERIYTVFRWAVTGEFLRRYGGTP